jgi:hypothetical protein
MNCPGCAAQIPWLWLWPYKVPYHQWDHHKTVCENYPETN